MRRRFTTAVLGLLTATLLVLTACTGPQGGTGGPGQTGGTGSSGDTVNVFLYQEPKGLFGPLAPANGPDLQVTSLILPGLLGSDPEFTLSPVLAESYEVSDDATTFTFTLRPDLTWSDGEALTSADVLFTYRLLADPKSKSATAGSYTGVKGVTEFVAGTADEISGFTAPDDRTFVITATTPNVGLAALIGQVPILPEHVLADVPVDQIADGEFMRAPSVSSGPFQFEEYRPNQYVHLTANPEADPAPKVQQVYLRPMTSEVSIGELSNGGLDVVAVLPQELATVEGMAHVTVQERQDAGFVRIAVNQSKQQFADPRVRQAFLYAVDRQGLVDQVLGGKATVQNSDFTGSDITTDLNDYAHDPERARQLLAAAGWDPATTVVLRWIPGQADRDAAATIVQNQLAEVGVKVELRQVQATELTTTYQDKSYDMVLYGGGNYATSPYSVNVIAACQQAYPNGGNIGFFCNERFDQLLQQANGTADDQQRLALYDQAAKISNEQVDLMWLYSAKGLWAVNQRVSGFEGVGSNGLFWNAAAWEVTG